MVLSLLLHLVSPKLVIDLPRANTIEVRLGKIDLTPPELLPLGGYTARQGRRAVAGGDTLFARTVDLKSKEVEIAVVSVEMLTVPDSLRREVEKQLPSQVHLFLSATHTHSAPDSQMLNDRMTIPIPGIATFQRKWLDWYASRIAQGILEARASKPIAGGPAGYLSWQTAANRPRRKKAQPSPNFTEIEIGETPVIAHFAAHATIYDDKEDHVRADWPGLVQVSQAWEVLQGAIGDVSPNADLTGAKTDDPHLRILKFWRTIMFDKPDAPPRKVGEWPGEHVDEMRWLTIPIALPSASPSPTFIEKYRTGEALAKLLVSSFAPKEALVYAWSIGKLAVIGVPGEPSSLIGQQIEAEGRKFGWRKVLVVSHCNGWIGYILTPEDFDDGGYEASLQFYGRNESSLIVNASVKALKALSARK